MSLVDNLRHALASLSYLYLGIELLCTEELILVQVGVIQYTYLQ